MVLPSMFTMMIKTIVPCSVFEDYSQTKLVFVLCVASLLCVRLVIGEQTLPWVEKIPFGYFYDPQYVGSIINLIGYSFWVPWQSLLYGL